MRPRFARTVYLVFPVLMASLTAILIVPSSSLAQPGQPGRWQGFYDRAPLDRTESQTTPDIRAILEQDIPRTLTAEERVRLAGVRIEFPREDATYPAGFYSDWTTKRIVFPVSSLRFLRDVFAAYAWLSVNTFDLQSVTDYLCMIKYQWPDGLRGVAHTPVEALGVPTTALDDSKVGARFQQLFGTAIVFILGHELGHIYHQHPAYDRISPEQARRQEQEADSFALAIAQRIGEAPIGAALYFHVVAHLETFAGDSDFRTNRANRTHPLSSSRIEAIADHIQRNAGRFASRPGDSTLAVAIAGELRTVARVLSDEDVQRALRQIGRSATPATLRPRRIRALASFPYVQPASRPDTGQGAFR